MLGFAACLCTRSSITQSVCEHKNRFSLLMTPLAELMAAHPQALWVGAGERRPLASVALCLPTLLSLKQRAQMDAFLGYAQSQEEERVG